MAELVLREPELVATAALVPHPRNYQDHPPEQLAQIDASLERFGLYHNVVIAADGTLLAGHGIWRTAQRRGDAELLAVRMPFGPEDPEALALVAADNELSRMAIRDEAALAALVRDATGGDPAALLGTGITAEALVMMIARTDGELPAGFEEILPRLPPEPQPVTCPDCGCRFIP